MARIPARDFIQGQIVDITRGATSADLYVEIDKGVVLTVSMTNEVADDLQLEEGVSVDVLINFRDDRGRSSPLDHLAPNPSVVPSLPPAARQPAAAALLS
jgi:molybdopterin-binding protein